MSRRVFFALALISAIILVGSIFVWKNVGVRGRGVVAGIVSPISADMLVIPGQPTLIPASTRLPPEKVTVLLLGLDGRKGDARSRCDAIHMITLDPAQNHVRIISVPRGTPVEIPNVASESSYLSNSCHILGLDYGIHSAEAIAGVHADHVVKVGFSQTKGILRFLGYEPTETLQFLRDRRLPGGDVQRTHNQAMFLKDAVIDHLQTYGKLPRTVRYLLFRMIDTDMDFDTANELFEYFAAVEINRTPDQIELVTKPSNLFAAREMHLGLVKSSESFDSAGDFLQYQRDVEGYIASISAQADRLLSRKQTTSAYDIVNTPFRQQIWRQIEDDQKRNQWYFEMLRLFVTADQDKNERNTVVLDYITEMEALNFPEYVLQGKSLFESLQ